MPSLMQVSSRKNLRILTCYFPLVSGSDSQQVLTPYGKFVKGSILSYQQIMCSDCILNLMNIDTFPELPSSNVMTSIVVTVLTENKTVKFDTLTVSETESWEIEKNTRLQSRDLRWHIIREDTITASNAGKIAKRRKENGWQCLSVTKWHNCERILSLAVCNS